MCHKDGIPEFDELLPYARFQEDVSGVRFNGGSLRVAILPDIYGLTDFYKGYASFVARIGADVYLTNPWQPFGDLPRLRAQLRWQRQSEVEMSDPVIHAPG